MHWKSVKDFIKSICDDGLRSISLSIQKIWNLGIGASELSSNYVEYSDLLQTAEMMLKFYNLLIFKPMNYKKFIDEK